MRDPEDILDIGGIHHPRPPREDRRTPGNRFLSVWFRCCNVYGRLNRNSEQTRYEGRCPRCGAAVSARIGADGTSRRMFEAQ